jgi:hypothetical protein
MALRLPHTLLLALVAAVVAAAVWFGAALAQPGPSKEQQARTAAASFFEALNAKQFERACTMLSRRFYRENHVRDAQICRLALWIGMVRSDPVSFRIVAVDVRGREATVTALADGAPGTVRLVEEQGRYKVLALEGV